MREYLQFYINGEWVDPLQAKPFEVLDPATEEVVGHINLGSESDVDKAVLAASEAFKTWSQTSKEERLQVLDRIIEEFGNRLPEMAEAITEEMGALPGCQWVLKLLWASITLKIPEQCLNVLNLIQIVVAVTLHVNPSACVD